MFKFKKKYLFIILPAVLVCIALPFIVTGTKTLLQINAFNEYKESLPQMSTERTLGIFQDTDYSFTAISYSELETHLYLYFDGNSGAIDITIEDDRSETLFHRKDTGIKEIITFPAHEKRYTITLSYSQFSGVSYLASSDIRFWTDERDPDFILRQGAAPWDYYLYIPQNIKTPHILVIPNNTGRDCDYIELHRSKAYQTIQYYRARLADELGISLLVPVFPRQGIKEPTFYSHSLDRPVLTDGTGEYERLDIQLITMVDDARKFIENERLRIIEKKFIILGFSAAGAFADRMSFLHPERLLAVVAGGSDFMVPLSTHKGENLPFPIGTWDIEHITAHPFNQAVFRELPRYLYKGAEDHGGWEIQDGVKYKADDFFYKFRLPHLQKEMATLPIPLFQGEAWSYDIEKMIKLRIYEGKILHDEFLMVKELFSQHNYPAHRFVSYQDVAHWISGEMHDDVKGFLKGVLKQNNR